jgi:cell division protein FtsL
MLKYLKWVIVGGGVLVFYVWQQTQSVRLGYKVESLQRECDRWSQENRALRLRVNKLISLDRLDKVAQEKKLLAPEEKNIVYLE